MLEHVTAAKPDFTAAHVLLATLYYKLKRPNDGARERAIVDRLTAEEQKRQSARKATPAGADPAGSEPRDVKP